MWGWQKVFHRGLAMTIEWTIVGVSYLIVRRIIWSFACLCRT